MIQRLTMLFAYHVYKKQIISHEDIRKMQYAMEATLNEFLKMVCLILLFYFLGKANYFIFSFSILASIRVFSGGIHAKNNLTCLLYSAVLFLFTCILFPIFPYHPTIYNSILLGCLIIIGLVSPYPNRYRPIKNKERRWRLKLLSILTTLFWAIILFVYITDSLYLKIGIGTILIQAIQLLHPRR